MCVIYSTVYETYTDNLNMNILQIQLRNVDELPISTVVGKATCPDFYFKVANSGGWEEEGS